MATMAAEYANVVAAIQALTTLNQSTVSFTVDGMTVTYNQSQLPQLRERQRELARFITTRNVRKRTSADFSAGGSGTLPV